MQRQHRNKIRTNLVENPRRNPQSRGRAAKNTTITSQNTLTFVAARRRGLCAMLADQRASESGGRTTRHAAGALRHLAARELHQDAGWLRTHPTDECPQEQRPQKCSRERASCYNIRLINSIETWSVCLTLKILSEEKYSF